MEMMEMMRRKVELMEPEQKTEQTDRKPVRWAGGRIRWTGVIGRVDDDGSQMIWTEFPVAVPTHTAQSEDRRQRSTRLKPPSRDVGRCLLEHLWP